MSRDELIALAENNLFGATKRMARRMGCEFVLNARGRAEVADEANRIASLRAKAVEE